MPLNLAAVRSLKADILDATEQAATDLVLPKAVENIPKKDGVAARSGRVVRDGGRIVITFGKDDDGTVDHAASNAYVEVLEEDSEMRHTNGMAHFLQRAGDEMGPQIGPYVAGKVKR